MDLYQLETLLAVAREKGFSRAAQKLHRTQSAVSQTIGKLEEELGETLFDRSSRDGALTDAGRVLVDYAEELLNLRVEARDALLELRQLHKGKLVIAANEFTSLCLLPILHEFRRLHPAIKIQIQRALASDIQRLVISHNVEFGVLSFDPADDQLTSTVFYQDELVFVVYPKHPLARTGKVAIRDLGAEAFIAHNIPSPYRAKVIEAFKRNKAQLQMNVELPTLEAIKQFVRLGNGVALLPRICVDEELKRGDLVEVDIPELRLKREMQLVFRRGGSMSHAGTAFLKVCEAFAARGDSNYTFEQRKKPTAKSRPA